MNKRGDFTTIMILVALVLGLAIGSIIFYKVFYEITEELQAVEEFSELSNSTITTAQAQAPKLLDFFVFFTLVAFFIGLIISSIYIDVNPAVIIIFIVAMIIAVILAGQMSNVFDEFVSGGELTTDVTVAESFPLTTMVLGKYFPVIILIIGAVVIVILYGKSRRPVGGVV